VGNPATSCQRVLLMLTCYFNHRSNKLEVLLLFLSTSLMKRGARAARTLLRAQGVRADACAGAPLARLLFCSPAVQSCDAAARESWRLSEVAWRHFSTDLRETATADVSTGPAHAPASLDDSASALAGAPLVYEGALAETVRRVKVRRTRAAALRCLPNVHSYCPSRAWC